jgi:DNA mismatch repair protein MutS2
MNEHSRRVLEFDRVTALVAGFAASEAGREAVSRMLPVADREIVEVLLRETREFTRLLQRGENPPLGGIFDVRQAIEKLGPAGSVLAPAELLHTAMTLAAGRRIKSFFQRFEGRGVDPARAAPLLCAKAAAIRPLQRIEDAVFSALDDRAEVRDSASPELRKVRKQLARTREDILGRLSGMLQDSGFQKVIQEPVITVRDDRYVLPLKPNFRQNLRGVVHGQSGSRATLFVEPLEVLEQNNRLAELRMEEQGEVERILRELTGLLAQETDAIGETICALSAIDAIYARARFGIGVGGTVPAISPERCIRLRSARHPLLVWKQKSLGGREVAPNDIELRADDRALILSGPNAGGKTVVLKTVGLCSLMAQAGLPITAGEDSEVPCFGAIFADIGDEQSLEQDLSTFSSHAGHIAGILRKADKDSLVLLDELGAGTDPAEGAGLGAAVLESLIERGALTLVTTHHNVLKLFGAETRGARNAAMEFDPDTLRPTFRLIPGRPGRSYGLDMAARIGIPDDVVQNARDRLPRDDARLESLLRQVEADTERLAAEREALGRELAQARQERSETESALRTAREEARSIKAKAKAEAREVAASLRQRLRELSRAAALSPEEIKKTSGEIAAEMRKLEPAETERDLGLSGQAHSLQPGDRVRLPNVNRSATIVALRRGMLELDMDGKKVKLPEKDLMPIEPVQGRENAYRGSGWNAELLEQEGLPDRVTLIGLRVEDGLVELERFIDHASARGLSSVTVIHGLGTGALKTAVAGYLKNHPLIAVIRPGEPAEGGAGVTVAELKK